MKTGRANARQTQAAETMQSDMVRVLKQLEEMNSRLERLESILTQQVSLPVGLSSGTEVKKHAKPN